MNPKPILDSSSMAALTGEAFVLHLVGLRNACTARLSDEVIEKIKSIREACVRSDTNDSQIGWRQLPAAQSRGSGPNEWRSGSHNVYRPPQQQQRGHNHNVYRYSSQSGGGHGGGGHGGGGHGSGGHGGGQGHGPSSSHNPPPGQPGHQRYVSRFKNSDAPVEETILNQIILNKLNKFSEKNYEDVKAFLKQILDSDDTSFLKEFMQLVFRKAASEPVFCPLYAQLICELSKQYTSLLKEFEILYTDYLQIFEDIEESKCPDYETFVRRNREKLYRLGYSQFLAELINKEVLQADHCIALFSKVLDQTSIVAKDSTDRTATVDEYIQCLLRMTRALKDTPILDHILCFEQPIEYLIQNQVEEFPGLTKKSVFALMDCLDILRKNV